MLLAPSSLLAHDPDFTSSFDREGCTFATTGDNAYFPVWPGLVLTLEGEEEDDEGDLVEISSVNSILTDTEMVDGVLTRVLEEKESEDGELTEISRNFIAVCRETGDVWYFGEDVDDYEDGEIVGHEGAWRAGIDGAEPGILMPGSIIVGSRFFQEIAPGIALDRSEIIGVDETLTVPVGTFEHLVETQDTDELDPDSENEKFYARGLGQIKDDELELVAVTLPACVPDAKTHCLNNGRFKVQADWTDRNGNEGDASAILSSGESGEFWFFSPTNTELLVKVIDACSNPEFNSFWVFAGGLTNVELTIEVTDTQTGEMREYDNPQMTPFAPILDTQAFQTCP